MNGTGSRWDHDKVEAKAFGKQVFQALSSTYHLLQRCFIHTPENKVLMHQCAIVASPLPSPKGKGVPTACVSCFKEPLPSLARSRASLLSPSSYACTGFADSKHSVDDLRLNNEYWIMKSSSDQREEMVGYADMNVQSSNIKIQSVGWYHLHDCAMAHQRFIFQESEYRYPLKEDDKVDDGFGKLAFWKPNFKLNTGSEWAISIHSHFLNILLWFSALHL